MKKSATMLGVLCALVMILLFVGCNQPTDNGNGGGGGGTPPAITYTVTFDSQGGSDVAAISGLTSGAKITKPTDPTKENEQFGGWYKEPACTNKWDFATDTVTENKILYAKWGYVVGETGPAGGKIFYVNPTAAADGWTYLEAALADLEGFFEWGAYDKDVGGTNTAIGSGKANTAAIIAALAALNPPETGKAAQEAKAHRGGGKDDWFLPSKAELNLMYTQKGMIGGFEPESAEQYESWYFSSSQDDKTYAFSQIFDEVGTQNFNSKRNPISVRVIRSF